MRQHALLLVITGIPYAAAKVFSVNEDFLAFPQYQIVFSDKYVLDTEAESSLSLASSYSAASAEPTDTTSSTISDPSPISEISTSRARNGNQGSPKLEQETYEYMVLNSSPYLCILPVAVEQNQTDSTQSKEEEAKELARATERGAQLLKELEAGPCLYYESGWWSYSFCHNRQVKQFHRLPPPKGGSGAAPVEDSQVPSFILGQFPTSAAKKNEIKQQAKSSDLARVQTRGDMRYMVQQLYHGDICDITGRPRRTEIQFHCSGQSVDRIGFIKEVSTCSYLMIIYTPRLCNDVAFQPSKASQAQEIVCKEILKESEVKAWQARKSAETRGKLDAGSAAKAGDRDKPIVEPTIGGIKVGGKKEVGTEGRRIDPPKVVAPADEQAGEVVLRYHPAEYDGKIQQLNEQQLQELELDADVLLETRKQLEEHANGRAYEIRLVEAGNGIRELRGIVDDDDDILDDEQAPQEYSGENPDAGDQTGSQETYKDEL